jgi:hypothetical protein
MPLISQESLARDFWVHLCESKDGSTVHTQNNEPCFFCSKTEQQVKETPPTDE